MPSPQSSTPQLFETASRPVRPASWMAAMRAEGMPQRPKPPTESDIPSRIPAMASWGVETTLSMAGLYPRGWPGVAWGRPTRSARRVVAEHVCRPVGIRARRRLQGAGVTRMNDSGVILGRREEQACNSLERLVMVVTGVHKWGSSKPFLTQNQPVPARQEVHHGPAPTPAVAGRRTPCAHGALVRVLRGSGPGPADPAVTRRPRRLRALPGPDDLRPGAASRRRRLRPADDLALRDALAGPDGSHVRQRRLGALRRPGVGLDAQRQEPVAASRRAG